MVNVLKKSTYTVSILLCMFLFNQKILGQGNDTLNLKFTPSNQIKIGISPTLYQGLKLTHKGEKLLQSSPAPSIDIGIGYYQHIKSKFGVNVWLHWSVIPYRYMFDVYVPEIYAASGENLDHYDLDIATQIALIPIGFQYIVNLNPHIKLNSEIGITLNYVHPYEGSIGVEYSPDSSYTISEKVFKMTLSNYQTWHIGYFAKIGLLKTTKKAGLSFGINFLVHYTPKPVGKGTYVFSNILDKSSGTVELGLNYIGLEFVYGLTIKKKASTKKKNI